MPARPASWKTTRNRFNAIGRGLQRKVDAIRDARRRLFSGCYPCGIVYADKSREVRGDYARLAFLPYRELRLEFEKDCPEAFREVIEETARPIIAMRGKDFEVSACGQTVKLGA